MKADREVFSPFIFNVYANKLLKELCLFLVMVQGLVLCIVPVFVAYADDITLISATVNGMQEMLDICSSLQSKQFRS